MWLKNTLNQNKNYNRAEIINRYNYESVWGKNNPSPFFVPPPASESCFAVMWFKL